MNAMMIIKRFLQRCVSLRNAYTTENAQRSEGTIEMRFSRSISTVDLRSSYDPIDRNFLCQRVLDRIFLFAIAVFLFGNSSVGLAATTYYVDRNNSQASDNNPGTQSLPWRTIGKASNAMMPGDTAVVSAGNYNEKVSTSRGGASNNRITFRASGKAITKTFNVNHDYITIEGFEMTAANEDYMMTIRGSHCEILNNIIYDTGAKWGVIHMSNKASSGCLIKGNKYFASHGPGDDLTVIVVSGSNHVIEDNEIGPGIDLDAFRVWGTNNVIRRNYVHDVKLSPGSNAHMDVIQTFGLGGGTSRYIVFENNLVVNFDGQICMTEYNGSPNMRDWDVRNNIYVNVDMQANIGIPNFRFYNNTLYNVGATNKLIMYLYDASGKSSYDGARIKNNVFVTAGSISSYGQVMSVGRSGTNIEIDHNYVGRYDSFTALSGFSEAHGVNGGDPKFLDPSMRDFRLQSTSPLIDKAISISSFNHDSAGTVRPQGSSWDIGALEYRDGTGTNVLSPPSNLRVLTP